MPLNIVRPFICPGISQHFHNKKTLWDLRALSVWHCTTSVQECCQKGVSSLFAEDSTWSTALRSNSPGPSLHRGKNLCCNKMLLTVIKLRSVFFFFYYGMSLVAPKKQLRESPVILVLQSADDPVITAGKIQQHSWSLR